MGTDKYNLNCRNCFKLGMACYHHRSTNLEKFVVDGVHISYWVDMMAKWLATKDNEADFRYTCRLLTGARFEEMTLAENQLRLGGLRAKPDLEQDRDTWKGLALAMSKLILENVK